jgi:uncharacterized membrane protein YphA (DoxX/SURF4 family)
MEGRNSKGSIQIASRLPTLLNGIARVLLCLVFLHAVIGKLTGFTGVAGMIAGHSA